ncbi:hypothetical protein B7463_g4141, partial [Scytalidium lignicola]
MNTTSKGLAFTPRSSHFSFPNFIQAPPTTITEDDLEYLKKKDALTIPERKLRDELLKCYIKYVHCYLPLVDLQDFVPILNSDKISISPVSLLLFQTMMFAGAAFIENKYLQQEGFENRKTARNVLFQRAKVSGILPKVRNRFNSQQLLFELDYEQDPVRRTLAVLLMTYWNDTPEADKGTWHWMGVALMLCRRIGLHRDPEPLDLDIRQKCLLKRIWWSCFMREHLIALGMRKPPRISGDDFDVPMLTLDDFEFMMQTPETLQALKICSTFLNHDAITGMARLCIEKVKMCSFIGRILKSQYQAPEISETRRLVPKLTDEVELSEVFECDEEIEKWHKELPTGVQYHPLAADIKPGSTESILVINRALLQMMYSAVKIILHRPQAVLNSPTTIDPIIRYHSNQQALRSAIEITQIAHDLHESDLSSFLPTSGVTFLVPGIAVNLLCAASSNVQSCSVGLKRLYQSIEVLQKLQDAYVSADVAMSYLQAAAQKLQVPLRSIRLPEAANLGIVTTTKGDVISSSKDIADMVISTYTLSSNEKEMLSSWSNGLDVDVVRLVQSSSANCTNRELDTAQYPETDGDCKDFKCHPELGMTSLIDNGKTDRLDTDPIDTYLDTNFQDLLLGGIPVESGLGWGDIQLLWDFPAEHYTLK